jgi:hypothetical protein
LVAGKRRVDEMRGKLRTILMVSLACFFSALGLRADTVSMTLTNPPPGNTLGDVYVDPYTATVNGVSTAVICDDWSDNTYTDETWTANVTNEAEVSTANPAPKFGDNQALYNEVTWLADQMLPATSQNATEDTELSIAIWDLTYGANGTNEETPAPLAYLETYGTSSEYGQAITDICEAEGTAAGGGLCAGTNYAGEAGYISANDWEILTPTSAAPTCSGAACPTAPPQEFLVEVAAEPSSLALLAVELLLMAGFAGFVRWRRSRTYA